MLLRAFILTTAAIVVSASADAQSPAVFPTGETSGNHNATGTWGVSPGGGQVNVHWLCPAFEHDTNPSHQADLSVILTPVSNTAGVASQVLQGTGSTDLANGQSTTSVLATAAGLGVANFQLTLQANDTNCPEGAYQTTVEVTLTSP